jgi:hypothetical protein
MIKDGVRKSLAEARAAENAKRAGA